MSTEALYKYLPPERLDVLSGLRIRFTQVSALNDPFESLPAATIEKPEWYRPYFARRIDEEIRRRGISNRSERRAYERRGWKDFGHFLRCYTDGEWLAELSQSVQRMGDAIDGCLSLSATCTNILMWSHYTKNHTGYVLGFNAGHEFFGDSVTAVRYSSQRPKINPFEARHSADIFYTKSADWSYEQEYRKFLPFGDSHKLPNGNYFVPYDESAGVEAPSSRVVLVPLPKDAIRCVVLGWKSVDELREGIAGALASHGLSDVPIFQARPSLTEYRMELSEKWQPNPRLQRPALRAAAEPPGR